MGFVLAVIGALACASAMASGLNHAFGLELGPVAGAMAEGYRASLGAGLARVYALSPISLPAWIGDLAGYSLFASLLLLRGPVHAALTGARGLAFGIWLVSGIGFGLSLLGVAYALISQRLLFKNTAPDLIATRDAAAAGAAPALIVAAAVGVGLFTG